MASNLSKVAGMGSCINGHVVQNDSAIWKGEITLSLCLKRNEKYTSKPKVIVMFFFSCRFHKQFKCKLHRKKWVGAYDNFIWFSWKHDNEREINVQ